MKNRPLGAISFVVANLMLLTACISRPATNSLPVPTSTAAANTAPSATSAPNKPTQVMPAATPQPQTDSTLIEPPVLDIKGSNVSPPPGYPADQAWPPKQNAAGAPQSVLPPLTVMPVINVSATSNKLAAKLVMPRYVAAQSVVAPNSTPAPEAVKMQFDGQTQLIVADLRAGVTNADNRIASPFNAALGATISESMLSQLVAAPNGQAVIVETMNEVNHTLTMIDTNTSQNKTIIPKGSRFMTWSPDSSNVIVQENEQTNAALWINLSQNTSTPLTYTADATLGEPFPTAYTFSPDGRQFAEMIAYPQSQIVDVAVRVVNGASSVRTVVAHMTHASFGVPRSLIWSPDGKRLAWIINTQRGDGVDIAQQDTQLWIADLASNNAKSVSVLATGVNYTHTPLWSRDGAAVIAIAAESGATANRDFANNVYVFDAVNGARKPLTQFRNTRVSHLTWSPDGKYITLNRTTNNSSGEVWATNLQGTDQFVIASPAQANAPFTWMP